MLQIFTFFDSFFNLLYPNQDKRLGRLWKHQSQRYSLTTVITEPQNGHQFVSIITQQEATIYILFMSENCSTCFGWYHHLKHVERFADINKLYIVASCWVIINIYAMRGPLNIKWSQTVVTTIPEVMKVNQRWTNLHSLKQKSGNISSYACVTLFLIF